MTVRALYSIALSCLVSFLTIFPLHAESYAPLPKPNVWPFYVQVDVCPFWAHARGEHGYYRECKDRPIATGTDSNAIWQTKVLHQFLPYGVAVIDVFPNTNEPPERVLGAFEQYIQAASQVPGARIAPLMDIVLPNNPPAPQAEREGVGFRVMSLLLNKYGSNPCWLSVQGAPVILDYARGGIDIAGVRNIAERLQKDGLRFYWITDIGSSLPYTLEGKIDEADLNESREAVTGYYSFGAPVNQSQGGYDRLSKLMRESTSPRVFGVTGTPGLYSCRLEQRNFEAARGTATFREVLDKALTTQADFISAQTWNDYVEGAHVEPSYKHTSAQLEILRHYAEERSGEAHPDDKQPHLIASYRKNIFAGESLDVELLNLPIKESFRIIRGRVTLKTSQPASSAVIPFELSGEKLSSKVLSWKVPASLQNDTIYVTVEVETIGSRAIKKTYINLPPVPVINSGELADPLTFSIPLHRLFVGAPAELLVNNKSGSFSADTPRVLSARVPKGPQVEGISYMRSGAVINDPTPETALDPVVDNWPEDRTRHGILPEEYYGALIHFKDGTIAYTSGMWIRNPHANRVWADYNFCGTVDYMEPRPGRLSDRSGHGYHGELMDSEETNTKLQWSSLGHLYDALVFDGKGTAINLPGARSFPIGPITVELLVKPEEAGIPQSILSEGGEQINISLTADGRVRARHANSRRDFDDAFSQTKLEQGKWALIVATYDMNSVRLFVDGKLEAEVKTDGLRPNEGARLGAPFWNSHDPRRGEEGCFKGQIARLRILDGVTHEEDISELYRQVKLVLSVAKHE